MAMGRLSRPTGAIVAGTTRMEKIFDATFDLDRFLGGDLLAVRFYYLFELLAPVSLTVQAIYLLIRPRLSDPAWAFGAGFAVLLVCLGGGVWVGQFAYCRVLLPLSLAFNLLLHAAEQGPRFWCWFTAGNLGLTGMLGLTLYQAT